jgi:O-antigen/teichoic acid export membrane protein
VFQFSVPEVARRQDRSARDRWRLAVGIGGGLGLITLGYIALLLVMPAAFGTALFGDSWAGAATVLLAMGCSSVASSLANGPAGVLYGMGQARATFRINLTKGPVLVAALLVGTLWAGAIGAGWAFALVEALILPAWVLTLRRSLRSINARRPTAAHLGSGLEELDMVERDR